MDGRWSESLVQAIRRLAGSQATSDCSDRELLMRFVRDRDEAAFAALLGRHGAMVLATCRRVLRQAEDAEDAFQATFLVLGRKAGAIRRRESLAGWLHGVAYRVASNLRRGAARRRSREARAADPPPAAPVADVSWGEVRAALDEELGRLPERYRLPLVLCYLEGKTRDEAARQLGWSLGAVRARLARGRDLLRARLTRRGLTLAAALVAPALAQDAAAVPPALVLSTVQAAAAFAAGTATAPGLTSAEVVVLAEGVSKAMTTGTWKLALALLLALAAVGTGAGVLARHGSQPGEDGRTEPPAPEPQAAGVDRRGEAALRQEVDRLRQENTQLREEVRELRRRLAVPARPEAPPSPAREAHYKGQAAGYWVEALKDKDPAFAADAVKALALIGDPKTIPALVEALKDPRLEAEVAAKLAVFGKAARPAVPDLLHILETTRDSRARGYAALRLFALVPADALPAFARMLKHKDADRRLVAAEALGGCGQAAVPLLIGALKKDPDIWVRRAAAISLGTIGEKHGKEPPLVSVSLTAGSVSLGPAPANLGANAREAVPALIEALAAKDMVVRAAAAEALGRIGPDAASAAPALRRALRDEDAQVRKAAEQALGRIERREPGEKQPE